VRLTNDPAVDFGPRWSPDGTKVAFVSDRDGSPLIDGTLEIYVMNADGTGVKRLTYDSAADAAWSPAGGTP
jgi:TolB protein